MALTTVQKAHAIIYHKASVEVRAIWLFIFTVLVTSKRYLKKCAFSLLGHCTVLYCTTPTAEKSPPGIPLYYRDKNRLTVVHYDQYPDISGYIPLSAIDIDISETMTINFRIVCRCIGIYSSDGMQTDIAKNN
ncbi:hypothetical protein BCR42DRAFT_395795 [Absidia repens]|uniref:Uncharacterized protein n=1 Tax=Absidia repens TaxID=90262 RepID=A0A1X2I6T3_9FUNG|nr:hypothetical protein BCR42DRAFT_395795 [Absidia repens]